MQKKALETALAIYKSNPEKYEDTMFCPYCGQPLIKSGEKRKMETLSEHVSCSSVSEKEVYVCSADCKFSKLHIWNEDPFGSERGNCFISDYWRECYHKSENDEELKKYLDEDTDNKFISALNSDVCENEVSIYKTGLKRTLTLPSWLTINSIQPYFEYAYVANKFGQVTKCAIYLRFWKIEDEYSRTEIIPFWDTLEFLNYKFNRTRKRALACKTEVDKMQGLLKAYKVSNKDSFSYRLFAWYITKRHYFEYKNVLKYFKITDISDVK
ncbi:hypothetical protein II906_13040 [bacterium]|nr:hypothetical protein [bacterium]